MTTWADGSSANRLAADLVHKDTREALRRQNILGAMGIITETCQRGMISTGSAATSGQVVGNLLWFFDDDPPVVGLAVTVTVLGSPTTVKLALINATTGARAAVSANEFAQFASVGDKPCPFTSIWTPVAGAYYAVWMSVGGTGPTVGRMAGAAATAGAPLGSGTARLGVQQTGQTDIPNPMTFTNSAVMIWLAAYGA